MKTLSNPQDKQELLERVARVRNDSPRAWGKMSAPQMICHLNDSFRTKLDGIPVRSLSNLFTRTFLRWGALWVSVPWPHGIKTPPELDQQIDGTPPADFEADTRKLVSLAERFAGNPDGLASATHPYFGKMTVEEWMRWAYLHMDHHLRQFGC